MKIIAPKTYQAVYYLLENKSCTQIEIAKKTKISLGQVNKTINWLLERDLITKKQKKYHLRAPLEIINLIALHRPMKKVATFNINIPPKKLTKWLKEKKAIFCLTSALRHYSNYYRDPSIHIYYKDIIEKELKKFKPGLTNINLYQSELDLKNNTIKKNKIILTSKIRTIIDLFCMNQAYAGEELIKELW